MSAAADLQVERRTVATLTDAEIEDIWRFYRQHCTRDRDAYEASLRGKTEAYLLRSPAGDVRGLTTAKVTVAEVGGAPYRVVAFGMAAVDPAHRGHDALFRAAVPLVEEELARGDADVWAVSFVVSPRVYLLLSRLLPGLHPRPGVRPPRRTTDVLAHYGRTIYGDRWDPERWLVEMPLLYPEAANGLPRDLEGVAGVRFFRTRNPRYPEGAHLACIAAVTAADLAPLRTAPS